MCSVINIKTITLTEFIQLLDNHGILLTMKVKEKDIVASLCYNMKNLLPTIIYVDCYYEKIRTDAYNVEHIPHALLVYGVDLKKQYFNIIEHDYKDSLLYKERRISFEDIKNAYTGFIDKFMDSYNNTFFTYKNIKPPINDIENIYHEKYINGMKNNANLFVANLDFIERYRVKLINGGFACDVDKHISNLNKVIMAKKIELYRNKKINIINTDVEKMEEIESCWCSIRAMLLKYKFSKKISQQSIDAINSKLKNIIEYEKNLLGEYI